MTTNPRNTRSAWTLAPVLALALVATPLLAGEPAGAKASPAAAGPLDSFRALAGTWEGTNSHGQAVKVTYETVAGGSAVLEHLTMAEHPDMVTLFHMDGESLILTHYCAMGNQPRMRATTVKPGEVRFDFVRATNLPDPAAGHMRAAVFTFKGPDRLSSAWTFREGGKDVFTETIEVQRVAAARASN